MRFSWTLFPCDKKLDLTGCSKRCGKCSNVRPVEHFELQRLAYGCLVLDERCESCRNPAENDKQGELGL